MKFEPSNPQIGSRLPHLPPPPPQHRHVRPYEPEPALNDDRGICLCARSATEQATAAKGTRSGERAG